MVASWHIIYQQEQGLYFRKPWWCQELFQWEYIRLQVPWYNKHYWHRLWGQKIQWSQSRGYGFCHCNSDGAEIFTCLFCQVLSLVIWHRARLYIKLGHIQLVEAQWKYFSDRYYHIEQWGHLSSDNVVDKWGNFQCQRVSMVFLWISHSNQQLVRLDQRHPVSPGYWTFQNLFFKWGILKFCWCGLSFDAG